MPDFNHEKTYRSRVLKPYKRIAQLVQGIIAKHVGANGRIDDEMALRRELEAYGEQLRPWANAFWSRLMDQQVKVLERDWKKKGVSLPPRSGRVQAAMQQLQSEQVDLIVTLPQNAAAVAQETSVKAAQATGERAQKLIGQLQGLEPGYPEFAARRLARTEIAKSQSLMVKTQAEDAGITHYMWVTMDDGAVREAHKDLDGKIFAFDDMSDKDGQGATMPGQIFNCRCFARPLLPDELKSLK